MPMEHRREGMAEQMMPEGLVALKELTQLGI